MFLDPFFDQILVSGDIFSIKLRSGGSLFREKGSMVDFRGPGGPKVAAQVMLLGVLGFILGAILGLKID